MRNTGSVVAAVSAALLAGCLNQPVIVPDEIPEGYEQSQRILAAADFSRTKATPDCAAVVSALKGEKLTALVLFGVTKGEAEAVAKGLGMNCVFEPETGRERGQATLCADVLVDVQYRVKLRGFDPCVLTITRQACYCISAFRLDSRALNGQPFDKLLAEQFVYTGEAHRPNFMAFTWDYAKDSSETKAYLKQFKMMTDEQTFAGKGVGFGVGWWHAAQWDIESQKAVVLQPGVEAVVMGTRY